MSASNLELLETDDEIESSILFSVPTTLSETGLSENFLIKLLSKHLYEYGILDFVELTKAMALPSSIVQSLLDKMKAQALIEVKPANELNKNLRYGLTNKGHTVALDAMNISGYIGPAPVPLDHYNKIVQYQSVHERIVTEQEIRDVFDGIVIQESILDKLGPAFHSGRAIFVYGDAGAGKTYACLKLTDLLSGTIFVPYAIAVGETVLQMYDPQIHRIVDQHADHESLLISRNFDKRFLLCERPTVIVGSELMIDDLEIRYDPSTRQYHAPQQLKANNGLFLIDDLGRQRISTEQLLNRWIVPMEEKRDYHNVGSGKHFSVPFDLILVFSTNLDPKELADPAFLRRIGHKIRFRHLSAEEYGQIWYQYCEEKHIPFDPLLVNHVIENLHYKFNEPMLPCHPRDLIGLAYDKFRYQEKVERITSEHLDWAWNNYFVSME